MKKIPEGLKVLFKYGAFSIPFVNYFLENASSGIWKYFSLVFKYAWNGDFKRAIHRIDRAVKNCRSMTARYILLANKLSFLKSIGQIDQELYKYLKQELPRMSKIARSSVINILLNIEASGLKPTRNFRLWGNRFELNEATLAFLHLAYARRSASQRKTSIAVHHYVQAYKLSKTIPHPSGVVSSLNDLAWDIKDIHPLWAYSISQKAVYWLGYYRETPGNLFGALDTLFVIEKSFLPLFPISRTSKVIAVLSGSERYSELFEKAKEMVVDYGVSSYENTEKLKKYLKKILNPYRKENVSMKGICDILTGRTKKVRGDTLKKLLLGKTVGIDVPFPVFNEIVKTELEEQFERALKELKQLSLSERKRLFISTYTALLKREKFYLSRKDKLKESYELLGDVEEFGKYMSKRYETMEFVVDMVKAHPYVEGRKAVVRKAIDRMGARKLDEFVRKYIELDEHNRKLLDRFLRNYGRYDWIRFGMRVKGPEVVRRFARKYNLKIQPSFLAYWCEDDGRTRRRLERVLDFIQLNLQKAMTEYP